jgi:hypothetical protein
VKYFLLCTFELYKVRTYVVSHLEISLLKIRWAKIHSFVAGNRELWNLLKLWGEITQI